MPWAFPGDLGKYIHVFDIAGNNEYYLMTGKQNCIIRFGSKIIIFLILSTPSFVHASDFFEALFNIDDSSLTFSSNRKQSNTISNRRNSSVGQPSSSEKNDENINVLVESGVASGTHNFCVRMCDGYHFPLIKSKNSTKQKSCELACPSAPMAIYRGASIENSRNSNGELYAALKSSIDTPDKKSEKCHCNVPDSSHAYYLKTLRSDPTLKDGDVIFEHGQAFVYQKSSFIPIENSRHLPADKISDIKSIVAVSHMHPLASATAPQVIPNEGVGHYNTSPPVNNVNKRNQ
jgi:hypothetical protein